MLFEEPGKRFELTLTGYQFPEFVDEEDDANWLDVRINVDLPEGSYAASSPCLLTGEVGWIVRWLENIARDVPQTTEIGGLEPYLSFEHLRTEGGMVALRIRVYTRMAPPWLRKEGRRGHVGLLDFRVPRSQVIASAESLRTQLQRFPPRGERATRPPFTVEVLSPYFFIDWALIIPAATVDEATATAVSYLGLLHFEPVVRSCSAVPHSADRWFVRVITDLSIPQDEPFRALFQMLSRLPMPYGAPRIYRPHLRPDGLFTCKVELAPTREEAESVYSRIRGQFELTNHEDEQRFRRWYGTSPGKDQ
jgi:hypothetical protein